MQEINYSTIISQKIINKLIYSRAQSILNEGPTDQVWGLHSIDTNDVKIYKGCFITPNDSSLFISILGESNGSSGNASRLNIIAHLKDSLIIDYYEQGVLPDKICDYNSDGVDDLFFNVNSVWMGYCNDHHSLESFANKKN